jgi:dihydrodipicolinate synthase/N-acetylneuraminate lyase
MLSFDAPSVLPALLTPFDERGEIDAAALRDHVEYLIEAGVQGIMPCGTTGETALLEPGETLAIVQTVVEAVAGRVPVIAHVGRPATATTTRLIEAAIDSGAAGVSAIVPYYYACGDREIVAHFRALLRAARGTPLLAYTFPKRTGNDLSVEAFKALVDDGLAGLKDSTSDDELHAAYLAAAPDAQIFVGSPSHLLHSLRHGSRGGVAALANLRPDLVLALARAWRDDDPQAEALQEEVRAAERALAEEPALVALKRGVSELMAGRGSRYPSALRSPLGT